MAHLLIPFAQLPRQVVALGTIANRGVSLPLLASSPQATSTGTTIALPQPVAHRRDPRAEIGAWRHGGINE
jgi:hypothetical protein